MGANLDNLANFVSHFPGFRGEEIEGKDILNAINISTPERRLKIVKFAEEIFSDKKIDNKKLQKFAKHISKTDSKGLKQTDLISKAGRQVQYFKKMIGSEEETFLTAKEACERLKKLNNKNLYDIWWQNAWNDSESSDLDNLANFVSHFPGFRGEEIEGKDILNAINNSTPERRLKIVKLAEEIFSDKKIDKKKLQKFAKHISKTDSKGVKQTDLISKAGRQVQYFLTTKEACDRLQKLNDKNLNDIWWQNAWNDSESSDEEKS